ncbi:MAG: type II secretion system F family protein [Candidatus Omnitrophota bacterium]
MKFYYKAKKGLNEEVEGVVEAASQDAAVAEVRKLGLVTVSIEDAARVSGSRAKKTSKAKAKPMKFFSGGKISKKQIHFFSKKLRALLRSQEPILKCLYFLQSQTDHKELKKVIEAVIVSVKDGHSFSDSLEMFPQHFTPLYIGIVRAGETSGRLDYALEQITKYLDNERQLSQKIASSLAYPVVMVGVGFSTIIFIITFVIPKLKGLFEDFGDKLPIMTKILLNMSDFSARYWLVMSIFFGGLIGFLVYSKNTSWMKRALGEIKRRLPVVKTIIYNQSLSRFTTGLSILLSSGVSLLESIKVSIPLIGDETAKKELGEACNEILAGTALEESLQSTCKYLPDMFIRMMAVGEASGRLDEILTELADTYSDEVETATRMVTSLIEPVAILVVGGVLSFIVISVLLPIFEMSMFME